MVRKTAEIKKRPYAGGRFAIIILAMGIGCNGANTGTEHRGPVAEGQWEALGSYAADRALDLIGKTSAKPSKGNMIVMTNAGYAEVNGSSTQQSLNGLTSVTGASRGENTLIEINSASWTPLWFAVFDKESGYCAYLEPNPAKVAGLTEGSKRFSPDLFSIAAAVRIDAEYLYAHASDYNAKFNNRVFGGNESRVIAIANAVAAGAPAYVVRTLEYHNHYCPGITSGILTAQYVKTHFPSSKSGYFVHALEPYCKEDALMMLLNATPAIRNYAVMYPTESDRAARVPEAENASTIVYRKDEATGRWEGLVLEFEWAETSCPKTGNDIVDRLCASLWYLERMDRPDDFVKIVKEFKLPEGVAPADLTMPHADPLKKIGLTK